MSGNLAPTKNPWTPGRRTKSLDGWQVCNRLVPLSKQPRRLHPLFMSFLNLVQPVKAQNDRGTIGSRRNT